ncbi:MAG: hypothetical protein ACOY0T_05730 [Myxococcota bacterium]
MRNWKRHARRWIEYVLEHVLEAHEHGCPPKPPCESEPSPPRALPDRLTPEVLAPLLVERLAGTPASANQAEEKPDPRAVVWVDHGDEVIVHLDSLKATTSAGVLLVAVDLESDETGRATLVVPFAPGNSGDDEMTLVTEQLPRGHAALAARWGHILQDALFAALQDMARVHAEERQAVPKALTLDGSVLSFRSSTPS